MDKKELGLYSEQAAAMNEYMEVKYLLEALPKNQRIFGLVHYDFEPDNVFMMRKMRHVMLSILRANCITGLLLI